MLVDERHVYDRATFEQHRANCVGNRAPVTNPQTNLPITSMRSLPLLDRLCSLLRDDAPTSALAVWVEAQRLRESSLHTVVEFCALANRSLWQAFQRMDNAPTCLRYLPLHDLKVSATIVHMLTIRGGLEMASSMRATLQDILSCGCPPNDLVGHVYLKVTRTTLEEFYGALTPIAVPSLETPMMQATISRLGYIHAVQSLCGMRYVYYPSQVRVLHQLYLRLPVRFKMEYEERLVYLLIRSLGEADEALSDSIAELMVTVCKL